MVTPPILGGASSRPHPYKKKAGNLSQARGAPSSGFGARYQDLYSQHSEYTAVHQVGQPFMYTPPLPLITAWVTNSLCLPGPAAVPI